MFMVRVTDVMGEGCIVDLWGVILVCVFVLRASR